MDFEAAFLMQNWPKPIASSFKNRLRDSVPRKPLFLTETEKIWLHSDFIYDWSFRAGKISFNQNVSNKGTE